MTLATQAAINAALPGQSWNWLKTGATTLGAVSSVWQSFNGTSTGGQFAPSSGLGGDVPTSATAGAPAFVNPASGNTYLARISAHTNGVGPTTMLAVYDRLWHNSGIDRTSTGAQTISANDAGAVHLTRPDANGDMVEAWWEIYVTMGTGTPIITLAYTDQDGNAETTGVSATIAGSSSAPRTGMFQLAAGDTGVRSIQTWTQDSSFGAAGTIGAVLRRKLTEVVLLNGIRNDFNALSLCLPRVYDSACLETLWYMSATVTFAGGAKFHLVQG